MFSFATSMQQGRQFKTMQIYSSWLQFPLRFSIHWRSLSASASLWWLQTEGIPTSPFLPYSSLITQHFSPINLCIYLWYGFISSHFLNGLYSLLHLIILVLKLSLICLQPVSCDMPHIFSEECLLSSIIRCCRLILHLLCPSHFSEELWFLLVVMV